MCHTPLHPFLRALPKCEHHLHLEGCLTPAVLFRLAAANSIDLPSAAEYASPETLLARYATFSSLDDFLHYYYIGMSVLLTASDFEALAWDYLTRAHADGVRHAELSFDPQAHLSRGVAFGTILAGVNAARARAAADLGLSSVLICCFLRHLPLADALAAYELAEPFLADGSLAGIGLDSSEKDFPPSIFAPLYERAGARGFRRTAHAGEECGPESVRDSLRLLGTERIDHGRTLVEDEALLKEVAERQILVTCCPISNVVLRGVTEVAETPIRRFLDAGVRFSINSDDPSYFGGYILENYCQVQESFDLKVEEWIRIATGAVEGSWCSEERKTELKQMVEGVQKRYASGELQ